VVPDAVVPVPEGTVIEGNVGLLVEAEFVELFDFAERIRLGVP
jgi:hypothetical protein